jgi:hypothetical protein
MPVISAFFIYLPPQFKGFKYLLTSLLEKFETVNPSAPQPKGWGLLRVDPEQRFSTLPSKARLGAVERVNILATYSFSLFVDLYKIYKHIARGHRIIIPKFGEWRMQKNNIIDR